MKLKINNNYILGACVLVLFTLCLLSIWQPIHFDKERARREQVVKQRLMKIRTAEENYKRYHGAYTADWATLVREKWIADSLQYVPFAEGKKFSLTATTIISKTGKQIPLMECGTTYDVYLDGLDADAIQQAIDQANYAGLYPGLKIGDITTDNNNAGNW